MPSNELPIILCSLSVHYQLIALSVDCTLILVCQLAIASILQENCMPVKINVMHDVAIHALVSHAAVSYYSYSYILIPIASY